MVETQAAEVAEETFRLLGYTAGDYRQMYHAPDGYCYVSVFFGSREGLEEAKTLLLRTLPGSESYRPAAEGVDIAVAA